MDEKTSKQIAEAQKQLDRKRNEDEQQEGEKDFKQSYKLILEKRKAQAKSDGKQGSKQSEKAQAQKQNKNDDNVGPQDQSMADLRWDNFKAMQKKLSLKKSIVPNLICQCNIFAPNMKGRSEEVNGWRPVKIFNNHSSCLEIFIERYQLNQFDLTVLLGLYHFINHENDFLSVFKANHFLEFIKRRNNDDYFQRIKSRIRKIRKSGIYIKNQIGEDIFEFEGAFVHYITSMNKEKFIIGLSEPLYKLFRMSNFSLINMEQRLSLKQKDTAQAFHAYLSTHKCPSTGLWLNKFNLQSDWSESNQERNTEFMKDFRRRVVNPLIKIGFLADVKETKKAVGFFW